jgi:hypothetical protein
MTYPDSIPGDTTVGGIFKDEGPEAEKVRDRLVAVGMEWFHNCQNQRTTQERQWYLNLAFFMGQQYVQFRQAGTNGPFDLYTPKAPQWRVRMVVNQVRKIVRKEISRLCAQKPNAFVIPASSEDADVFAAQAGEAIWDSLWRKVKFNKVLREVVFWQAVCGNGFIKSYWDPYKVDPDTTKPPDPENPEADLKVYGDICIEKVTPFHLFVPDLMCTNIEDQCYVIHAQVRSNSWIKQMFNIDGGSNKLETVDDSLLSVMQVNRNTNKKDQSIVLEIWVKPNYLPELPQGGVFTIAAGELVSGFEGWPYEHGQYPFSKIDASPTGKFYNTSIIEDLIPLQRELNRSRSQLIESKNKMTKPQLVAQKGAIVAQRVTTEPGQIIFYEMGFEPPQPLPLQNLPSYVTEEINRLYDDMADISGQHEVSNGSTPPGVTAATAISFLQEQDESLIAGQYSSIEEAVEKIAAQSLVYVKMYWDEERTVKVVGLDGTFDVQTFKNSDINGNTDIRVESGSALPTSRAAKQAFIMDLMKMGFIQPDEGLEILEVGGLNRIYERIQIDKRQAQRENLKMRVVTEEDVQRNQQEFEASNPQNQVDIDEGMKLVPPLVIHTNTYDNHELHIQIHNNYRKSQNFESAPSNVKILFEAHVREHMEASMAAFTGQLPVDPNALPDPSQKPQEEDGAPQDQGTPGPEPMPELQGEQQPQQGGY